MVVVLAAAVVLVMLVVAAFPYLRDALLNLVPDTKHMTWRPGF